jgi:putative transposase
MNNATAPHLSTVGDQADIVLPETVTVALAELAGAAREGLLALACGVGLEVMTTIMAEDVDRLAGPKGKHDPDRAAVRHGTESGSVVLGGRKTPVRRPRVRTADGTGEVAVPAYELFSSTDVLGQLALERMLAGLSTRRYPVGLEPVGTAVAAASKGTSKSAVSRRFVALTKTALDELLSADLSALDIAVLMIDGVHFAEHLCVVALAIDYDGRKHPIGLVKGSTENATVVRDLLAGMRDRGLATDRPILVVIDGAKALASAVTAVFDHPVIQRCQLHKIRNVLSYLPKNQHTFVERKMRTAYRESDHTRARSSLIALARSLEAKHPDAAGSLREGLDQTLTVLTLELPETLARTLRSTNAIESMIGICRDHARNVKRWRDGDMVRRWCAAGMIEAGKQFRRIKGYRHLPALRDALARHIDVAPDSYVADSKEVA